MRLFTMTAILAAGLLAGCGQKSMKVSETAEEGPRDLRALPLYQMTPQEVGEYIALAQQEYPDLRDRVVHLGRKNIGQPYELYLLGEFPYETYDPLPLFCIEKSDCVVFSEHAYAMALSSNWEEFFWTLQRIRYRDGIIGVASRNHFTEGDWNPNNSWLVTDLSSELAGDRTETYRQRVDRARFLKNRYKVERDIPVETITVDYVPLSAMEDVLPQLQNGDYVNVIVGRGNDNKWATHVGLVAIAEDGTRNFLHSTPPRVREETFDAYIQRSLDRAARTEAEGKEPTRLYGFKFLRLNDDIVVPPAAPQPRP